MYDRNVTGSLFAFHYVSVFTIQYSKFVIVHTCNLNSCHCFCWLKDFKINKIRKHNRIWQIYFIMKLSEKKKKKKEIDYKARVLLAPSENRLGIRLRENHSFSGSWDGEAQKQTNSPQGRNRDYGKHKFNSLRLQNCEESLLCLSNHCITQGLKVIYMFVFVIFGYKWK